MWCVAKWRCRCGGVIHTSGPIPHPDGFYVLSEEAYNAHASVPNFDLIQEAVGAHVCRNCTRLRVWWDGWDNEPTVYQPERD